MDAQTQTPTIVVAPRFAGPPGSGNGGYTAGLLAERFANNPHRREDCPVVEVTLRKPPPLGVALEVVRTEEGLRVIDPAGAVIATARRREEGIEAVPPVTPAVALAATDRYPGHGRHHFPTCFVCGPQRPDGLRVFPGRVDGDGTAAVFVAPQEIDAVTVWAALDCPGGWTVIEGDLPWVLGRFAVDVDELPKPGDECVITGRAVRRDGRKALVRTTLYASGDRVLARGEATWIQLTV